MKIRQEYLDLLKPSYLNKGYSIPKWIQFCETMLSHGWSVSLHRAKTTVSKYVYIRKGKKNLKIRFSNHRANRYKEQIDDCDYYVGVGNFGVITTEKVIEYILGKGKVSA